MKEIPVPALSVISLIISVIVTSLAGLAGGCPHHCKCLWRASKITVDCAGALHTALPSLMTTDTQVLNMTHTTITSLESRVFLSRNLSNLQRLYITESPLTQIHSQVRPPFSLDCLRYLSLLLQAFTGLLNLVELDLSANKLYKIPTNTFHSIPNLHSLSLKENNLRVVPPGAFVPLPHLLKLDLRHSEIKHLLPGAFSGLERLERLYLSHNLVSGVERVEDVLPVIHELRLEDNPWRCDCGARTLRLWLEHTALPSLAQLACAGPDRLSGRLIRLVPLSSLACSPVISPASMLLSVGEARQVSLTCNVQSDPLAVVSWAFKDSPLDQLRVAESELSVSQQIIDRGVIRSVLTVRSASSAWNGTFHCRAENSAGSVSANYSLHVERLEHTRGRILDLKLEYFILLTAGVLGIFVISVLFIILVLALIARKTLAKSPNCSVKSRKVETPRKISRGEGVVEYEAPDIISDVSHSLYQTANTHSRSHSSCFSLETTTTPASLTSSTNAVLQPSLPVMPPPSCSSSCSLQGTRRGWATTDHFLSFQFPVQQNNWRNKLTNPQMEKYPPDFGLPRISVCQSQTTNTNNLFGNRKYFFSPDQSKTARLSGGQAEDHEYSQIASLTVTACDHHYESLPSLVNPPLPPPTRRQSTSDLARNRFLSLPVLDFIDDYPGESEI